MSTSPLRFTVLVPTRNRADTLIHCLKSVTGQDYPHVSVIVSDNKSSDHTREVVEATRDPRVRYVSPSHSLSMRDNWEFALSHVQGGWVSVLGDDDALVPGALGLVARVVQEYKVEAVTSSWCRYTWPDEGLVHANTLILPFGGGVEVRDTKVWRQRVLSGAWRYFELPYLYTGGFVSMDVVSRAMARGTRFFNSIIPDVYSAWAISYFVDKFALVRDPVAVRGTSSHSHGASSFQGSTNEKPKMEFWNDNRPFIHRLLSDEKLPLSTHLLVYEAYLQASSVLGDEAEATAMADSRRQLSIVSTLAQKRDREDIRRYEAIVLQRGNVASLTLKDRLWAKCLVKWMYLVVEIRRVLNSALIDMSQLGVRDVFSAGVAAKAIHWQMRHARFPRVRRILASLSVYSGFKDWPRP